MPVHLYEGHTGKLITTLLRPGCRMRGAQAAAILKRVLDHLIMVWPQTHICLRGDSHFSTPEVHDLCDGYGIDFILGQASNKTLKRLGAPLMDKAEALAEKTEKPVRLFSHFDYKAGSWRRERRVIHKAEITQGKPNPRFVVTNIGNRTDSFLYEKLYCARGRMEGFIKDHKTFLHSDRTSCHRFGANQFRLFLHSLAYVLLHEIKHRGMRGTQWAKSNFDTIQLRVLKVGARVREQATKVRFHLPTSYLPQGSDEDDRDQPRHRLMNRDDARTTSNKTARPRAPVCLYGRCTHPTQPQPDSAQHKTTKTLDRKPQSLLQHMKSAPFGRFMNYSG